MAILYYGFKTNNEFEAKQKLLTSFREFNHIINIGLSSVLSKEVEMTFHDCILLYSYEKPWDYELFKNSKGQWEIYMNRILHVLPKEKAQSVCIKDYYFTEDAVIKNGNIIEEPLCAVSLESFINYLKRNAFENNFTEMLFDYEVINANV